MHQLTRLSVINKFVWKMFTKCLAQPGVVVVVVAMVAQAHLDSDSESRARKIRESSSQAYI